MSEVQKPRKTQKAGKNLAAFNELQLQQLTCAKNLSRKGYGAISHLQNRFYCNKRAVATSAECRRGKT